ncbi:MAG: hypothetical protein JWR59_133 [Brevundimonas sp.]|nr:hypothetical protein [Brevundimonas sp.]
MRVSRSRQDGPDQEFAEPRADGNPSRADRLAVLTPQPESTMNDRPRGNRAVFRLMAGKASMVARVEVSTPGLFAIGALVSGILVSTAGLVWVATSVARDHAVLTTLRRL